MDTLISKLSSAIQTKRVTVSGLANKAGVSRQAIYHILEGKYTPNVETVERLAEAIGYSLEIRKKKNVNCS